MEQYTKKFYQRRHQKTAYSAETILSILLEKIPEINSAADIGCGVGTWLSVLENMGVSTVLGIEGNWVDEELLVIPKESFQQMDLSKMETPSQRYDLAISLEVAEHLPPESAEDFVSRLTELSDYILFSAAIPGQGGKNHVNEQWQEYWVKLFRDRGYNVHDFIRPRIWEDERIPFWYRQNILFFSKSSKSATVSHSSNQLEMGSMLNAVHPNLYLKKREMLDGKIGVRDSLKLFLKSWKNSFYRKFSR